MRTLSIFEELPLISQEAPDARLLETVSASRLQCWLQCRLKFYFRYVARIARPTPAVIYVGMVVHSVLQRWNLARWHKETLPPDALKNHFDNTWVEQQALAKVAWRGEENKEKTAAWKLVEYYLRKTPIRLDERPEAVEVRAEADLSRHGLPALHGILDLVRAGGTIVDFKTSAKTPDARQVEHQHEVQLCCYSVLYRDSTGKKEAGLELHHLIKTKLPKCCVTPLPPMNGQQETRLFRLMESYVAGIEREEFIPSPGFHCAGCEFFGECRKWWGKEEP